MLVLTRRVEEKIQIGENIVIRILGVEGGTVKIGIDAPRDVTIFRMEVLEDIKNENIDAAAKEVADMTEAAYLFTKKMSRSEKN